MEILARKVLNGEKVDVRSATWQNLPQFEAGAQKVNVFESQEWKKLHGTMSEILVVLLVDGPHSEQLVLSFVHMDKPLSVLPDFNCPPSALHLMGLVPVPIPSLPLLSSSFGVPPLPSGIYHEHLMPLHYLLI